MSHELRNKILKELIHHQKRSFNELWNKEGESNKFAYHLKSMEKDGLIEKKNERYYLSSEGKKVAIFLDGETGTRPQYPLVAMIIAVFKDEKILTQKRLKEPFYGYSGLIGGKLTFGEELLECAARELKEETSLTVDLEIAGIVNFHTYNDNEKTYHHIMFVVRGTNPKGKLKKNIREGENSWVTKEEFLTKKIFPNIPYFLKWVKDGRFFVAEMDRFQKNHEFKDIKLKNITWYGPKNL
ncbi:MAG: NUDIX domain-containing protein [Nanoarchaeota archaeon]|nr:NUDIX domain-containing protein [Nanoarchaeota archaeon]MBU1854955.1 NUDIX domain-containing protein [Nanoarchaeota archaeon]